ncbi:nicotinate-nucleotide/dimethylbenzimidazole phosphoribosyltransferase [Desulfonatronospira thiodismutans ASO3-1]|uniref:Nicotinate-nucleotide--dimethylbenzimidazole phosphoribosyltransferase n=1 Tax=Desulfonatronospira thiodismutans ASO3-1 TaxID=555779 RepID=D6SSY7_9BACT|nr:nicotinate-nucleotide--dimethylbenzimidazole phosphoribosyltransferase [Desulfonatronospira thiodismutans]EFI33803.1 nicotinate-nucleotide/dimethylbenzimidazole phosphoribosyltransferase [Desulfonatronospira thiodismutans ASO3-1]
MTLLEQSIQHITQPDQEIKSAALKRLANQARPRGSLGRLEPAAARLASICGRLDVKLDRKTIVTCAGDHGVVEEGVSLFPSEVTAQMVYNFVQGGASINVLAAHAGARVRVADLGVSHDFDPGLDILHKKIRKGTANMATGPAMTREEAAASVEAGIGIANQLADSPGLDLLGTGDMGIGNTTASSAIIAVYSGLPLKELVGPGTGLDEQGLDLKARVIKRALDLNRPDPADPMGVLARVGGLEIGGLAGLVIGAAARQIPVVCDGLISTAGALIACELCPAAGQYIFAGHRSRETGHEYMLRHLGLTPLLDLEMRLGEGTGAALAMHILDACTRILADIKTFEEVGIENAHEG